ncbi:MAG: CheR family methyltransferase [Thermodesulfobacteriota bacterium]|nr:CheR family methyltransferase [Thermodesulfobacteriota bacterium]
MAFTFFFRDMQTLESIRDHVIPAIKTRRYINIWDAGCAMGPEPYSLAIVLRENMGKMIFRNVKIYATDIDGSDLFGKIIKGGEYPGNQVQRIPKNIFSKYFEPNGRRDHFIIADEIRKCVEFQKHDLLSLKPVRTNFVLIVCKNVLLHFKETERINVFRMFHNALSENGFLAVEQTQKMPEKLKDWFEPVAANVQLFRKILQ